MGMKREYNADADASIEGNSKRLRRDAINADNEKDFVKDNMNVRDESKDHIQESQGYVYQIKHITCILNADFCLMLMC